MNYVDSLPDADALADVLLDLTVPHEDIGALLALRRGMTADPERRDLLEAAVGALVADMGEAGGRPPAPRQPTAPEAVARYFPVYALVAALPAVRAYHRGLGVSEEISRRTLADLGRQLAVHRRRHGTGGLATPGWLALHFRGEIYQLGRLQFQRGRLGDRMGAAVREAGLPYGPGDRCLDVHIPDFLGPLTPETCDRSFELAGAFFARHFPDEAYGVAVCESWLLDPQLAGYLPADSNIVRFQRRFTSGYELTENYDRGPLEFVFGDPALPVATLPRRTTLERAVGDHLRAGLHWYGGHGWLATQQAGPRPQRLA